MVEAIFLGTNGWYDTETGNTICVLIKAKEANVVLDAGNGIYKLDRYVRNGLPIHLFLSHFHLDHITGLHVLNKFRFKQGIRIYGPEGAKGFLGKFINKPFTVPLKDLKMKIEMHEIGEGKQDVPFLKKALPLLHSVRCLGFRLELEGKIIAYCTDTGLCDNAFELAMDSDLLIAECAYRAGQRDEAWPHLNPEDAACLAREANAKSLYLVHFDAACYTNMDDRKEAERAAQGIFKNTRAARDGMSVRL